MRVALIHYWLVGMRGGEKVLESLCNIFPEADIYTHVIDKEKISSQILQHTISTTFIAKLPFARQYYQKYLPLMPLALEQLDLRNYDLVISSESGPAKGVLTNAETPHICYCHTPMRYLWDFYQEYLEQCGFFTKPLFRLFAHKLRLWDVASATRVDHFIANSHNVARRIKKHYRRDCEVIYPPVDLAQLTPPNGIVKQSTNDTPYIILGQLIRYKSVHIAIEAFNNSGRPLVVVGTGEEKETLQSSANSNISFLGKLTTKELAMALQNSRALIFPGEEDFGIVPLEAMAAGKPVIAYGRGGALETVKENVSGIFFYEQTAKALNQSLDHFETIESSFQPEAIQSWAAQFSKEIFEKKLHSSIMSFVEQYTTVKK